MIANRKSLTSSSLLLVFLVVSMGFAVSAGAGVTLVKGQTVYVPAYSDIFQGDRAQPFALALTLSIRNTDPSHPIRLLAVDYHDDNGKLIRSYLKHEISVGPLASVHYFVKESDRSGGPGAKFIVKWQADTKVTEPIIETIMISTNTQQGISFTSRGQAIQEDLH
jgi:hypothetical protein